MDFDLDLAVKNSNENPIYYIEYANARISSILRGKEIPKDIKFSTIESDSAYTILNKLLEFEDKGVGKTTDLHNKYLTELLKAIRKDLKLGYKSLPILCLKK